MNDILKNKKNYHGTLNSRRGIALLIAVIASSALLLASIAISDIAFKQQVISYSGRESKIAFYAADAGLECALYHDLNIENFFPNSDSEEVELGGILGCDEKNIAPEDGSNGNPVGFDGDPGETPIITYFGYDLVHPLGDVCVSVEVIKRKISANTYETEINSRGYNTSCGNFSTPGIPDIVQGTRNVERALRVTY